MRESPLSEREKIDAGMHRYTASLPKRQEIALDGIVDVDAYLFRPQNSMYKKKTQYTPFRITASFFKKSGRLHQHSYLIFKKTIRMQSKSK